MASRGWSARAGEVFLPPSREALPLFTGPEGSAPRVLARYEEFGDRLGAIGRKPVVVHLSAREAWQIRLDDGLVLELGRDQPRHPLAERLSALRATTPQAAARSGAACKR
jgi:cell division protein FtsQ